MLLPDCTHAVFIILVPNGTNGTKFGTISESPQKFGTIKIGTIWTLEMSEEKEIMGRNRGEAALGCMVRE